MNFEISSISQSKRILQGFFFSFIVIFLLMILISLLGFGLYQQETVQSDIYSSYEPQPQVATQPDPYAAYNPTPQPVTQEVVAPQPEPVTSQSPPLPATGLPAGWTMEQWAYYGEQYLAANQAPAPTPQPTPSMTTTSAQNTNLSDLLDDLDL